MGQDDVTLDSVLRVGKNTREVGAAQGRAQFLQHQGFPQLGARAPVLPAGAEKKGHERTARGHVPPAGLATTPLTWCGPPAAGLGDAL